MLAQQFVDIHQGCVAVIQKIRKQPACDSFDKSNSFRPGASCDRRRRAKILTDFVKGHDAARTGSGARAVSLCCLSRSKGVVTTPFLSYMPGDRPSGSSGNFSIKGAQLREPIRIAARALKKRSYLGPSAQCDHACLKGQH
jgi:hypothetical protein